MFRAFNDNLSLRKRFGITFVVLVLIPLLFLSLIIAFFQYERTSNDYLNSNHYAVADIPEKLATDFDFAFNFANIVYEDYDINMFLNTKFSSAQDFYDKYNSYGVTKIIDFYARQSEYISNPVIYTNNSTVFGSTENLMQMDKTIIESGWYTAFMQSGNDHFVYFDEETRYASVLRRLNYNRTSTYTHIIKIDIDLDYVQDMLDDTGIPLTAYFFGDKSTPIYTWENGYVPMHDSIEYGLLEETEMTDDLALVFTNPVDYYGSLKFIVVMKPNSFLSIDLLVSSLLPLLITLVASLLFMRSMQNNYIKRVEQLVSAIDINEYINDSNASPDDKPKRIKKSSNNELNIVENTIEEMSSRIHDLIKESYALEMEKNQAEIRRKQSELNSLLSQINPHYLFNVLNAIRLKSIIKGEKETARIILYVSKIMRKSITWNEDVIPLSEEINFIKEYLAIEKYRFEDKLNYEINVDDETAFYEIPKMTLQPFVENACVHGVEDVIGEGTVLINVKKMENERFLFEITNPITDQFTDKIKDQIIGYYKGNFDVDTKSVGLKNTFARLRYYYDDFDFNITKTQNQTTFSLILPSKTARRKENEQ